MPELVEVEAMSQLVNNNCLNKKIVNVNCIEPYDVLVFNNIDENLIVATLMHRSFVECNRKGKYLWLVTTSDSNKCNSSSGTSSSGSIVVHNGMTGTLIVKDKDIPQYKSFKVDVSVWPPKNTRIEIVFDDDTRLAYVDNRRFGRITVLNDPLSNGPISKLASDALYDNVTVDDIYKCFQGSIVGKKNLKSVLLDQEILYSGLGNWMTDEILYQACLHPDIVCCTLNKEGIRMLHDAIHYVVTTAVKSKDFPATWLFHKRWNKGKGKGSSDSGSNSMDDGQRITFITSGGRTSAVVLTRQLLGKSPYVTHSSSNTSESNNISSSSFCSSSNKKRKSSA